MIGHLTGGKALPKEISEQIVDRTDGVPLFIEHVIQTCGPSKINALSDKMTFGLAVRQHTGIKRIGPEIGDDLR
jgi:hypothetical protein